MATYTVTTTAGQDAAIATAFGTYLGLTTSGTNNPRAATAAEVKAAIATWIQNVVVDQQTKALHTAVVQPAPPTVTIT